MNSTDRGFLIPEWYQGEVPTEEDMNTSSIFWGFSIGIGLFSAVEAIGQTMRTWKRTKRVTAYIAMIWTNWMASMVIGAIAWCFQIGYIKPSFWFFFFVAFFWVFQIQLLLQIIINRIGLLIVNQTQVTRLKWIVFLIILVINISVFCIWIPARLQINQTYIKINNIWDRCEKAIFCVVDVGLNLYFIRLVRTRLIENGLNKYIPLYRLNLALVCISMCLDVVLIGLMSLPASLVYLQFHPVAYLLKLQIEMLNADLIAKVVRSTSDREYYGSGGKGRAPGVNSSTTAKRPGSYGGAKAQNLTFTDQHTIHVEGGGRTETFELGNRAPQGRGTTQADVGITKTVETVVNTEPRQDDLGIDSDTESQSSSTRKLHYHHHIMTNTTR